MALMTSAWLKKKNNWLGNRSRRENGPEKPKKPVSDDIISGVVYVPTRCPYCGSKRTKITSTRGKLRYHRCKNCKGNFKSHEQE
jgi:transposase-like protein